MPKSELDPVADDEWLLRRVASVRFRDGKIPLVSPNAFEPLLPGPKVRQPDFDGISFYRIACLNHPNEILATMTPSRMQETGIVRVPVLLVRSLGMTISIRPAPSILGHVTIPELDVANFAQNRNQCRILMNAFAAVASEPANILLRPTPRAS